MNQISSKSKIIFIKFSLILLFILNFQVFTFGADINAKPQIVDLELNHTISIQLEDMGNSRLNYLNFQSYYILETIEPYLQFNSFSTNFVNEPRVLDNEEITYFEYSLREKVDDDVEFSSIFEFESTPNYPKITQKINYPLNSNQYSTDVVEEFTQFTPQINTNAKLQEKALELARGEDDVLVIATKVANWVQQEIEYDLSTVFENPDQNAVEIFESKQGVCKELSIVYASMLRSLGIPVRINSGFGYTTSEDIIELVGDNWGGHAWTEVLVGDEWVPFDLTYQQYGYVDSSHIPLQQSVDMEDLGVRVEMSSNNIQIVPNSLNSDFKFTVNSLNELDSSFINVDAQLAVNPLSYQSESNILVNATVENKENFYQIVPLEIVFPNEMIEKSSSTEIMILPPSSTKTHTFIVKMPKDMQGFSFPIALYTKSSQYELQDEVAVSQRRDGAFISDLEVEELREKNLPDDSTRDPIQDSIIPNSTSQSNISSDSSQEDILNGNPQESENQRQEEVIQNNLETFDFKEKCGVNSIKSVSEFEIVCDVSSIIDSINSKNVELDSIELCSGSNCNSLSDLSDEELKVITSSDMLTQLRINSISQSFSIQNPKLPELDIEYTINDSQIQFRDNMNYSLDNLEVRVVIGSEELSFNPNKKTQQLNLEGGNYIGVIYLYYNDDLVEFEKINFSVDEKDFIEKTYDYIKNFLKK